MSKELRTQLRIWFQTFLFPWPETLILIRHGKSVGNVEYDLIHSGKKKTYSDELRQIRNMDLPLASEGRQQAILTGEYLRVLYPHIDRFFVSPYRRAIETADLAFPGEAHRFVQDVRIREKDFGVFDAMSDEERRANFAEWMELKDLLEKFHFRLPGGENYPDMILRAHNFLSMLKREHGGEVVVVVAHSAIIECFRYLLNRLNENQFLKLAEEKPIPNAGVLIYREGRNVRGKSKLYASKMNPITPWEGHL